MPLLGLSQLLVFINPFHKQENVFDGLWILVSILIRTSQGAMVSFAYCFTNKEVLKCIRRRRMTLAGKIAIYFGCDGGSEINSYRRPCQVVSFRNLCWRQLNIDMVFVTVVLRVAMVVLVKKL